MHALAPDPLACCHIHLCPQAYSTPTLRAVIRHKWRLYARSKLIFRALLYFFYCLVFTVYCILYAMVGGCLLLCHSPEALNTTGPGCLQHISSFASTDVWSMLGAPYPIPLCWHDSLIAATQHQGTPAVVACCTAVAQHGFEAFR